MQGYVLGAGNLPVAALNNTNAETFAGVLVYKPMRLLYKITENDFECGRAPA